ncbi:MAG: family 78 glycoside hydrolase catalytic domain [Flectobacillus sp.]
MKKIFSSVLIFLLLSYSGLGQFSIQNLTVENLTNPIGIDVAQPRFSWQIYSDKQNVKQTAYEISVRSGKKLVWSSGKIASANSLRIRYDGTNLISDTKYTWQVKVWDNQSKAPAMAKASFQTALMQNNEWKAQWISSGFEADTVNGIVPHFRKTFELKKPIASATIFVTSRGLYEARINGKRVGDAFLTPGWTSYNKHLQYQTYDVTKQVASGKNAIGISLGSGWYRTRLAWENQKNIYGKETAILLQLHLKFADGTEDWVISDNSWKTKLSHITFSEIYDGERQDLRKEVKGWDSVNFDDSNWQPAKMMSFATDYLTASINEPIKKQETFKPIKVLTSPKGETILDFGQNMVGWVSFKISGKAGQTIKLYHAEMLDKYGVPYFENLRSAKAQAHYILNGEPNQMLEPHFTFFGFRYVKVEGLADKINPEDFTAVALHSDMKALGNFECSNPLVNQLQKNIRWGQKGNFLDVPTDCPQRDERLGWTGDAEVFSRTAAYNFNVNQFFAKWLKDVSADQEPDGAIPFVIPNVLGKVTGAAGWSDAGIIIPYNMYVVYGDKQILEDQYASMKAYLNHVRKLAKNDLWNTGFQFADWLSYRIDDSKSTIGQKSAITDVYLVAQCFYAYNVDLMIKSAKILQKNDEVVEYEALLERIKKAFQQEFMTASGRLISETQTAYVLALQFDMLPEAHRDGAVKRLVDNIKSYNYHLTTGFLGTPFLNPVLTRFGQNEIAYKLLLQDTYPSWLYPIKSHGATTIWERWDSMKPDSTFQDPSMTSFNHYAYGAVGDWMYRTIAGIDTKEADGAGYKSSIIKPVIGGGLTYAKGYYFTPYGKLASFWKIEGDLLTLEIEIPANTESTVYFPTSDTSSIKSNGAIVTDLKHEGKWISKTFGSGKYVFTMRI